MCESCRQDEKRRALNAAYNAPMLPGVNWAEINRRYQDPSRAHFYMSADGSAIQIRPFRKIDGRRNRPVSMKVTDNNEEEYMSKERINQLKRMRDIGTIVTTSAEGQSGMLTGAMTEIYDVPVVGIRRAGDGDVIFVPASQVRELSEDELSAYNLRLREAAVEQRARDAENLLMELRKLLGASDQRVNLSAAAENALRRLTAPEPDTRPTEGSPANPA